MRPNRRLHPSATPLAHTQLVVSITDLVAEYTIQQHFENTSTRAIEVAYSIPMPLDAAFLGMRAALGGETVQAHIQPAAHAEQTYNTALADGDSAALLSTPQAGVLFIALGNLLPGESGSLELRFACSLGVADQLARFNLPLVHRPRFGHWRLEELETPTHDFCVQHPMSATIRVAGLLATTAVSSNIPALRFQSRGDAIELQISAALLDQDLALEFALDAALAPTGHLIADGDANLALATFVLPSATSQLQDLDLYLLLDCSGSMSGDAILQSRLATSAVMEALDADDRIQILRFGSEVVPMFRRTLRVTPSVRQTVDSLLTRIQADLGGTEMNDALQRAVAELATEIGMWPENTRSRVVILVTDGAVQAEDIAAAQAAALKAGVRIFVVAVGSSAATEVLQPLAEATGGVMERAVPAEPIHDGVMRQLRRARMAAALTLKVTWPSEQAEPVGMRVAYPGDATSVAARLPLAAQGVVVVVSSSGGEPLRIPLGERRDNPAMRALIGQQRYRAADPVDREALALHYSLLCKETAAVLVKRRSEAERTAEMPEIVRVPQMLPNGMLSRSPLNAPMSTPHCSDGDTGYLSIPAFLRRSADLPAPAPAKPVLDGQARAALEAIYQTLLNVVCAQPHALPDTETLIRAIPKPLQPQARQLLRAAGPLRDMLQHRRIVMLIRSLGRLLAMPPPGDDQDTALRIAAELHAQRGGKDIDWWKDVDWWADRLAGEWQVPPRSS